MLMMAVFASKILGLVRDRLLVHSFNTSDAAIFFAAFRLPDLLFQILIFGALSVAFIPVFTDYLGKKGEEEAFKFASNILNISILFFSFFVVLALIFTPFLNTLFVPGFDGEQKIFTDQLTRIILLSQAILLVGSFFIGISQSYQRFIMSALAPIFYNLGIIFGIGILSTFFGILGPGLGVLIGALMHVLIQIPLLRSVGFIYTPTFNFFDKGVKEIFKLMSIRNVGLAAEQVSETVGIALASVISYPSVTLLTFAQHLYVVPIGLFGMTIAQAALPVLSREHSKNETELFNITFLTTMHQILFLTLPAAAILIVLRIPVVRLVFGASQFNWADTVLTGRTVAFFSLGLAAQAVMLLLVRAFYAMKDTKTPVFVSLTTVSINIILSLVFIKILRFEVWSLGLAYAIATNTGFILLLMFLNQKVGGFELKKLISPAIRMLIAALVAAVALYIPIKALDQLVFDTTKTVNLIFLTGIASVFGMSIYLLLVWLMRVEELSTFANLISKLGRLQARVRSEELVQETDPV